MVEPAFGVAPGSERRHRQPGCARQAASHILEHVEQHLPLGGPHLEIDLDPAGRKGARMVQDGGGRAGSQTGRPGERHALIDLDMDDRRIGRSFDLEREMATPVAHLLAAQLDEAGLHGDFGFGARKA
jgi:hypothetical protein